MRKSKQVALVLLPAFAAMFMSACEDGPTQQQIQEHTRACLDPEGRVAQVRDCEDMYNRNGAVAGHPNWFYFWYYMHGNNNYPVGSRVIMAPGRGSFAAPEGAAFGRGASIGSVSRGGFGATGHGTVGE
jgi:hypothetical protein